MIIVVIILLFFFSDGYDTGGSPEHLANPDTPFFRLQPRDADVFIGYSTTPGQMSPISRFKGTAFFQVLGQCLLEKYLTMHLDQIYTLVTDIVADKHHNVKLSNGKDDCHKHVPQKVSTLRQDLFFTSHPKTMVRKQHFI